MAVIVLLTLTHFPFLLMKTDDTPANYLDSLILLRGLAAVMVCFCHFGAALMHGNPLSPLFADFNEYGKYGVEIFFVISGFVIPLSLLRGKYTLANYGRFLYKRLLRLQPPYLGALALTLFVVYLSSHIKHVAFPESATSILASIFYLHKPTENPVFWSLAVEAEYYLFIGLAYLVMVYYPRLFLGLVVPMLLAVSYLWSGWLPQLPVQSLPAYIGYFLVGMVGFLLYADLGNHKANYGVLGVLLLFLAFVNALPAFLAALFAISTILFYRGRVSDFWQFPGKISYSLYLIHYPIGVKLINLLYPRINPAYGWVLFVVAFIVVFVIAWLFYRLVEEFSERLSRSVKYTRASTDRSVKVPRLA